MRIAVVQDLPIFLNTEATTELVLRKMRDASANGAELACFRRLSFLAIQVGT